MNIMRNIIYQSKNFYRDKTFLFWSVIYPIIMAIFFHITFSGLMNAKFEPIDVGINSQNPIGYVLQEIEVLDVHEIPENEVNRKLKDGEIQGFIDNELNLKVIKLGLSQTIIKEVLDQVKQMGKLGVPLEKFDFSIDYIQDKNQRADNIVIIFYSLIAMVSAYAVFPGIEIVTLIQANLTNLGQRLNIAPLKKNHFLLAGVIVSLALNLLSNGMLLAFIKYVLKIELFTELKHSMALIIAGNLFGVALGMFIGVSNKQNANVKTILAVAITIFLSFFSGMMSPGIRSWLTRRFL